MINELAGGLRWGRRGASLLLAGACHGAIGSLLPGGTMAEFFEVAVRREDGSEGLQYINIESISYVDAEPVAAVQASASIRIYLNNGYWFTVAGPKATEVLGLIKGRGTVQFNDGGRG